MPFPGNRIIILTTTTDTAIMRQAGNCQLYATHAHTQLAHTHTWHKGVAFVST